MGEGHTRTELLLELIANELFRLRMQLSPENQDTSPVPEALIDKFVETVDEDIISLRKALGMPVS
jgi:hypothetical protein